MPMVWKLNALLGQCKDTGRPVTYLDLSVSAKVSTNTIYHVANNKAKRADLDTIEAMLKFFSERLGRQLTVDDLLTWEEVRE